MKSSLHLRISVQKYYWLFTQYRRLCTEFSFLKNDYSHYDNKRPHVSVMVKEVIENLNLKDGDKFLDMTFGAGGHSEALMKKYPSLQVFALDRDPLAKKYCEILQEKYPNHITFLEGKFSDLADLLKNHNIQKNTFDGILLDLGCSAMQLDQPERGFSFNKDGPLDMRMDGDRIPEQLTAADVIAYASENDLKQIFKLYGEEKYSMKIARALVAARATFQPLTTTGQLVDLISTVCKEVRYDKLNRKVNVATNVFRALRAFINNEYNELYQGLLTCLKYAKPGGRVVALTFHKLEDKMVRRFFKNVFQCSCAGSLPVLYFNPSKTFCEDDLVYFKQKQWKLVNKKFIRPSTEEINENPRSRSAKLTAAVKILQEL